MLKITFLFFYLRIFPDRTLRRIIWVLISINILVVTTFVIAICVSCKPISYSWTQWDGEHIGSCANINALAFSNGGISIALDCLIVALPISNVWKLQLGLKKKIGVMLMLSVGAL